RRALRLPHAGGDATLRLLARGHGLLHVGARRTALLPPLAILVRLFAEDGAHRVGPFAGVGVPRPDDRVAVARPVRHELLVALLRGAVAVRENDQREGAALDRILDRQLDVAVALRVVQRGGGDDAGRLLPRLRAVAGALLER